MSKLDDLIKKLCPNGVEFHSVEDVANVARGVRVVRSQLADQGSYPVFQNSLTPMGYYEKQNCKADTAFVIAAGAAGEIGYSYSDFWAADDCYFFKCSKALSSRYLYHMLLWKQPFLKSRVRKASIPRLSRDHIEQLSIPVPPLPVQEEIVRILDSFTKLEAELEAELEARRRQYEYYRDKLLNFNELDKAKSGGVKLMALGEIIRSLKTGLNPRQNFKLNQDDCTLPYITGKDIFDHRVNASEKTAKINETAVALINRRAAMENGDLLFASTGSGTVGRMAIVENYNNDWAISETLYAIKVKSDIVDVHYLLHSLNSSGAKEQYTPKISKGSVPHLKVVDLLQVKIPILPLLEQQKIANLLNKFERFVNDLTCGLPSEIKVRRQQYEYYRDKLLTFSQLQG